MSCHSSAEHRRVLADLRELITALDKRMPQPHRNGERHIVVDAEELRREARARIGSIERLLAVGCTRLDGSIITL